MSGDIFFAPVDATVAGGGGAEAEGDAATTGAATVGAAAFGERLLVPADLRAGFGSLFFFGATNT